MFKKVADGFTKFIDEHLESAALYLFHHRSRVLAVDAVLSTILYLLGLGSWALWAHVLLLQNWAFTYVSRARNSGSLTRHLKAAFLSNGVWWISQIIIFSKLYGYINGGNGIRAALLTGLYYTLFTLTGSLVSHAQALQNEKGKAAVGANANLKQVSIEEWATVEEIRANWANVVEVIAEFDRVKTLAEQAHLMAADAIPTGVTAQKIAGQVVTTGLQS
jgi:hypothetical protein